LIVSSHLLRESVTSQYTIPIRDLHESYLTWFKAEFDDIPCNLHDFKVKVCSLLNTPLINDRLFGYYYKSSYDNDDKLSFDELFCKYFIRNTERDRHKMGFLLNYELDILVFSRQFKNTSFKTPFKSNENSSFKHLI